MAAPTVKLNNGIEMPIFGLGTFGAKDARATTKMAIKVGYRLFDTAFIYFNEKPIGQGIKERIEEGVVKREEIFVSTKLWNTQHHPDKVLPALKDSLNNLQLDYVDLYLMHWPFAYKGDKYAQIGPEAKIPIEDTWKAMEQCVKQGLAKSIGVCNFTDVQLGRILKICEIKPVANQVEFHPYFVQKDMMDYCKKNDIIVMAYMPLAAPLQSLPDSIFYSEVINKIGKKYGKSNSQVVLRYLTQLGVVPLPKSDKPLRIKQNISIFDFTLTPEDMEAMDKLNKNLRTFHYVGATQFDEYPFALTFDDIRLGKLDDLKNVQNGLLDNVQHTFSFDLSSYI